jgi:tetratricopeptide (TPR) repeat protein
MEFSPNNDIVKLCLKGMSMEENNQTDEAIKIFQQAWSEAENDFEKYLAAYYLARNQGSIQEKLKWYESSLQSALRVDNRSVKTALPSLYSKIAECYALSGDVENAKKNRELAATFTGKLNDDGPFYHGTRADLKIGELLTPGFRSNYKQDLTMNHIYFTALVNGAGLAAALANGEGRERVYIVEPTGDIENDPNVTDKKFPGNPTRSYRTGAPLKIVGEVTDWVRQTPEQIMQWRERLGKNKRDIIN